MSFYSELMNLNQGSYDIITINDLEVSGDITMEKLEENSVLLADSDKKITSITLNDGQILIGSNHNEPKAGFLNGTEKQINILNGAGSITLSLPQDIDITSSPNFEGLEITNNIIVGGLDDGFNISGFKADYDSKIDQGVRKTDSPSFNNLTVNNIDCSTIISTGDIKTSTNQWQLLQHLGKFSYYYNIR